MPGTLAKELRSILVYSATPQGVGGILETNTTSTNLTYRGFITSE
jgi:hypothetical protein